MRTQKEGDLLQAWEWALTRTGPDLGLLASRTDFLLFKSPSLWHFVMAAQADEYKYFIEPITILDIVCE